MRAILILTMFCGVTLQGQLSHALFTYPRAGWEAELSQDFHNVSGSVTIIDEDTLRVDDFTYDGGGIVVYFYLGASDTPLDFTTGLAIGDDLFGTSFDGTEGPMFIDLPIATTLDGYNAISVWCVAAGLSFGSGTFATPAVPGVPEPSTCAMAVIGLIALGFCGWRRKRHQPR